MLCNDKDDARHLGNCKFYNDPWENVNFLTSWKDVSQLEGVGGNIQPVDSFEEFSDLCLLFMIPYKQELSGLRLATPLPRLPSNALFVISKKDQSAFIFQSAAQPHASIACTYCLPAWNAISPFCLPSGPQSRVSSLVI